MIVHVSGLADPRLDDYRNVPDPQLLRARGVFVAEGRLVVRRLLEQSRFPTRSLLLTPAALEAMADAIARRPELPVYVAPPQTMNAITGFNIHRGCLAVGERVELPSWSVVTRHASLLVALERIANADNVGAIFRSAAAFGVDAVLLGPACVDPLYRKALRTSMGAALQVPFAALADWPDDLAMLRASGFRLVALTPAPEAAPIDEVRARAAAADARVAVLVGHEGEGLSSEALAHADMRARIVTDASVDSLNAATAAAIALYELTLPRRGAATPAATRR